MIPYSPYTCLMIAILRCFMDRKDGFLDHRVIACINSFEKSTTEKREPVRSLEYIVSLVHLRTLNTRKAIII